jgi:hypothetical protein
MQIERRRKRSSYLSLALQYWLVSVAKRRQLEALVLADSTGLLVAASTRKEVAEEIAALAPLLDEKKYETVAGREHLPIAIRKMPIADGALLLCALGQDDKTRDSLRQAVDGIKRILSID